MNIYTKEYLKEVFSKTNLQINCQLFYDIVKAFNDDMIYYSNIFKLYDEELPLNKAKGKVYFDFTKDERTVFGNYELGLFNFKLTEVVKIYKILKENYKVYNVLIKNIAYSCDNRKCFVMRKTYAGTPPITISDIEKEYNQYIFDEDFKMYEIIYFLLSGEIRKTIESDIKLTAEKIIVPGYGFTRYDEANKENVEYTLLKVLNSEHNKKLYLLHVINDKLGATYSVRTFNELFSDCSPDKPKLMYNLNEYELMRKTFDDDVKFFLNKFNIKGYDNEQFSLFHDNTEIIEKQVKDGDVFKVFKHYYSLYYDILSTLRTSVNDGDNVLYISNSTLRVFIKDYSWLENIDKNKFYDVLVNGNLRKNILSFM